MRTPLDGVMPIPFAAMIRASLRGSLGAPLGALLACAALAAWPLLLVLAPIVFRDDASRVGAWIYELAFMFGAAGIALATAARSGLEPWIRISGPSPTPLVDFVAQLTCGLAFAVLAILPGLALGGASASA